jgi:cyclase
VLHKRIIFALLYSNGYFYLSRNFSLQKVGDISWLKKNYGFDKTCNYIDEILILLITKNPSKENIKNFCKDLASLRERIFIPITIGGGIRNLDDAKMYFDNGADKININYLVHLNYEEVKRISSNFGSQSVSLMVDYKKVKKNYISFFNSGSEISYDIKTFLKILNKLSFGELILNSIDRDGTGFGFDATILKLIPKSFKHPILLMGGAGKPEHFKYVLEKKEVSGAITANLFNFLGSGLELTRNYCIEKKINLIQFFELKNL